MKKIDSEQQNRKNRGEINQLPVDLARQVLPSLSNGYTSNPSGQSTPTRDNKDCGCSSRKKEKQTRFLSLIKWELEG